MIFMSDLRTSRGLMARVTDQETIGRRVRAARRVAGLRQHDLAAACHVTRNAVTNWETGTKRLGLSQAASLLPLLRVTLDWLYLGDDAALPWVQREALAAEMARDDGTGGPVDDATFSREAA